MRDEKDSMQQENRKMNEGTPALIAHPTSLIPHPPSLIPSLRALTWDNPVLVKEFRTRMRGARAYWVLLAYVLLLTLVVGFMYLNWYTQTSPGGVSHQAASTTGRMLFQILFSLQAG